VRVLVLRGSGDALTDGFQRPPDSAQPWTYWFWINGNITREGITADLQAMARVGIHGVAIMDVAKRTNRTRWRRRDRWRSAARLGVSCSDTQCLRPVASVWKQHEQ
jgi:hypothetical protein